MTTTPQEALDQEVEELLKRVRPKAANSGDYGLAFWFAVRALLQQRPEVAEWILWTVGSWEAHLALPSTKDAQHQTDKFWEVMKREHFLLQQQAAGTELSEDEQEVLIAFLAPHQAGVAAATEAIKDMLGWSGIRVRKIMRMLIRKGFLESQDWGGHTRWQLTCRGVRLAHNYEQQNPASA